MYASKFKRAKDYLSIEAPGLWILIHKFKVEVEKGSHSAYLDSSEMSIIIPESWMNRISDPELATLLAHEALHGILGHWMPPKEYDLDQRKWNLACDVEVNHVLDEMGLLRNLIRMTDRLLRAKPVTWELFSHYGVEPNDPAETVYAKIKDKNLSFSTVSPNGKKEGHGGIVVPMDLGGEGERGKRETVWKGDEEFREEVRELAEVDKGAAKKTLARVLAEVIEAQKSAGNVPASLLRKLKRFLGSEVPWSRLLGAALREGLGTTVRTWQRPNRRLIENVPGSITKGTSIWCLVDTSGSISEEELSKFAGEIIAAARYASKINLLSWDAEAYETIRVRSISRLKNALKEMLKGGGGTVISEPLRRLFKEMRSGDAVIVFTDGFWFDAESEETRKLMESVRKRSSVAILVSTGEVPRVAEEARWRVVKITP
ncbi:hypothetical protein IPA_03475 [Ignicoccus pacificus DSM 13166]|uniref:VWFA domain-containing protein n=1 Tax=Ignicoccus pacificus DSM 13166 TaxID=940294 RepID=A0A977PLB2_9CREN|nr:hypothetical protein IPA_03475 [Ignicoccus pacificus DSM 13166]